MPDSPTPNTLGKVEEALRFLYHRLDPSLQNPKIAIVCGSGLGNLVDLVPSKSRAEFEYASIPHFPQPTVPGHAGRLVFGYLGTVLVVLMVGRVHFYEGHSMDKITFPTRLFSKLGVETMVLTNAAGGLNPEYEVGDIVVIHDHINLAGLAGWHPLRGPNEDSFGDRFPSLSDTYDLRLRLVAHRAWSKTAQSGGRRLHEGVYAFVAGPSYETRAECRMLRQFGADLVGMSTVPEIIVAKHSRLKVLALSLVTNQAVLSQVPHGNDPLLQNATTQELNSLLEQGKANHAEVLEAGRQASFDMQRLVSQIVVDAFGSTEGGNKIQSEQTLGQS